MMGKKFSIEWLILFKMFLRHLNLGHDNHNNLGTISEKTIVVFEDVILNDEGHVLSLTLNLVF